MVKVYYDRDARVEDLRGETVAVIGYGIQGRAQALNLRDSGIKVVVGNRADAYRDQAVADGFAAHEIGEAADQGDIVLFLIPDEVQGAVFEQAIRPALRPGKALVFGHGFAIRYGTVKPPDFVDLLLLAPRLPGKYVRDLFLKGRGVPAYVDVGHDHTGRALCRLLALAKANGFTRPGAMVVTFAEETELDHFSEHFVYPLIIHALRVAYEILVEEGYTPEAALMELHGSGELGEVLLEAGRIGLYNMVDTLASPACQVGIHFYAPRVFPEEGRALIRQIIREIKDGSFARELQAEQRSQYARLRALKEEARGHQLSRVEQRLRELISLER